MWRNDEASFPLTAARLFPILTEFPADLFKTIHAAIKVKWAYPASPARQALAGYAPRGLPRLRRPERRGIPIFRRLKPIWRVFFLVLLLKS